MGLRLGLLSCHPFSMGRVTFSFCRTLLSRVIHFAVMFIALDSMNGFCPKFNNRSLKPVSIQINMRAPAHVLKSLRAQLITMHTLKGLCAQLIALHYMNGFCQNFSHRLLKPKSARTLILCSSFYWKSNICFSLFLTLLDKVKAVLYFCCYFVCYS